MYFGSIAQYIAIVQAQAIVFENEDHYQKQTYRNRSYIYGANGKLLLSIPIKHTGKDGKQHYKDVRIENDFEWQTLHWKSLQTAYRTSPFFEYYEDEFVHLFEQKRKFLLDFNYECMQVIFDCLMLEFSYTKTEMYRKTYDNNDSIDLRHLIQAKHAKTYNLQPYTQVFIEKHGFIPNLSIVDLLFNEGTNALLYLENQTIFKSYP
ncbi:WbqC family protein [Aquimarina sp. U1-2]|nr:WbqC family protein [Aquimarina sp. U1-2]